MGDGVGDEDVDGDGDGVGVADADGVGDEDFDGLGDGDFDARDCAALPGGGADRPAASPGSAERRLAVGDGRAEADARVAAGTGAWVVAAAGLVAGVLTLGSAGRAWAEWGPVRVRSRTLTTATSHSTTAMAAIAVPGLLRILPHLIAVIASEKLVGRTCSALRRYMGVSGVVGEQSFMTSSRSPAGGTASGCRSASRPDSAAGRTALRR